MHALVHFFCDLVRNIAIFLSLSLSHFVCLPSRIITTTAALAGGVRVCVGVYVGIGLCMCMWVCPLKGHVPIWRTAVTTVTGIHRKHLRVYMGVCVSVCCCAALCRLQLFLLSLLPNCLSLPPCSKLVHTRVLDVPISSSDAKQKISACCTLLPRP